jgi:hypothetical protein
MLSGGHLLVQALAGQARAGEGGALFEEARQLDERRGPYDFSFIWGCLDSTTRRDLEAVS